MAGADDLRHEMSEPTNKLPYVPYSKSFSRRGNGPAGRAASDWLAGLLRSGGRREIVCLWALGGWIRAGWPGVRDERAGRLARVRDWDSDLG